MYSLCPTQNPFQFASPPYALWTLFLCLPLPSLLYWLNVFYLSRSAVNHVLPSLTKPPPVWSVVSPASLLLPDKAGFGNNFTTGDNKSVAQNMEAVVVGCMFKSLITRCASTTHELHSPENLVSDVWNRLPIWVCFPFSVSVSVALPPFRPSNILSELHTSVVLPLDSDSHVSLCRMSVELLMAHFPLSLKTNHWCRLC